MDCGEHGRSQPSRLVDRCDCTDPHAITRFPKEISPTRTGYAETNGARIYYQVHGDLNSGKTPLLVLHGSYMSAESMAPLVARFAATRPVMTRRQCDWSA
jgi:hypothetical protein